MITEKGIKRALGVFCQMEFFPGDEDSRAGFMELIGDMCENDEQALWLAKRSVQLYQDYPGIREIRAVLCSKYSPRDGIEVYSAAYLDGIPSEREVSMPQIAGAHTLALSAGNTISVDPELEKQVADLAEARAMSPLPKYYARTPDEIRVDAELRQLFKLGDGEVKA